MNQQDLERQLPELRQHFLRSLRRRLPPDVADDLVQDLLLALWQKSSTIQGNKAASYGGGILRNILRHHWRDFARRSVCTSLEDEDGRPLEIAVVAAQESEMLVSLLDEVLATSPADRRSLFVDVVVRGMTLQEAADTHGIPIGTVKSRISRMSRAVREALDGGRMPRFRSAA